MVEASDNTDSSVDLVAYSTQVRLRLAGLPDITKQRIWRDCQIQTQAYNWGVVHNPHRVRSANSEAATNQINRRRRRSWLA